MGKKYKVLLCDDQSVVRMRVRQIIDHMPGFEVVGEAEAGNIGVEMATDLDVDLVLMDVSMPGLDGIEATRQIVTNAPEVKVLICSSGTDQRVVPHAFAAGASGYLLKGASTGEMSQAMHSVMAGERYVSRELQPGANHFKAVSVMSAQVGPARATPTGRSLRVVLVDDSAVVRERVAATLSALGGVEVVGQASEVLEGMRLLHETRPDLLILDIGLPGESGITLLETAKKEKLVPRVMMLTNQDHPKLRQHCAELGADYYFHKPTEFEKMIDLCVELASTTSKLPASEISAEDAARHHLQGAGQGASPTEELARANETLRAEIQERQRVEQALRESQERYRQFVQMTTEGMARYEADTPLSITPSETEQAEFILEHARVVECNNAYAQQLGYEQATDAVGLRLADCMAGTKEEKMVLVRHFIQSGYRLSDLEAPVQHRAGQVIWTRNSLVGVVENNHLVRAWVTQQDITQRRQIEERIREQAQMLDLAHDAIIIRDLEDQVLFWNESAQKLFGWTAEELIGRPVADFLPGDVTTTTAVREIIFAEDEWVGEVKLQSRAGEEIIVESRLTLIRDRAGQPKSILAINTDITERKKLETQFMRSQRMESIGMLAGGIAHDLNNVLAPIIMSSQLLGMGAVNPEQQKLLSIILGSAKRGADLVKQVLTFYRGDHNVRQEVSPTYLIKELRHIIGETFPKSVQADTNIVKNLLPVVGDPTQLHQVLLNLCVNARDAMPNGGKILIKAENILIASPLATGPGKLKPTPHVLIQVSDTGTGIPAEIRERIFDPFFTTKAPGKGTGLGLSTSLAIVKNHGGFINVTSAPGQGSVFRVYLPALEGASYVASHTEHLQIPRGNGELVLVVDDEASVSLIMSQMLQTFGYRTIIADDGAEAIALYQKRGAEISAVLVDIMMPVMDGATTISKLAAINPLLKVIAASGLEADDQQVIAPGGCVKAFLPKPYTAGTLLKTLHEVLSEGGESKGDVVADATQPVVQLPAKGQD